LQGKRVFRSTTESISRLVETKAEVATHLGSKRVARHVRDLTRPNSIGKTMRTVGVALLSSPDIVTDVPGAALVAGSYVMRKKDPTKLDDLAEETRKILRDIQSLRL
jgi:hypothetical protein